MVAGEKELPKYLSVFITVLVNLSGSLFNKLKSPSFGIRSATISQLSYSFSNFFLIKGTEKFNLYCFCSLKISLHGNFSTFYGWQLQSCWKFLSKDTVSKNHSAFDRYGRCPNITLFSYRLYF